MFYLFTPIEYVIASFKKFISEALPNLREVFLLDIFPFFKKLDILQQRK